MPCAREVRAGTKLMAADPLHRPAAEPPPAKRYRPTRADQAPHPLAHVPFDSSHRFGYCRGIAWCWRCGAWTTGLRPLDVTRPCPSGVPLGRAGRDALRRLRAGKTPREHLDWPLPEGAGPPPGLLHHPPLCKRQMCKPGRREPGAASSPQRPAHWAHASPAAPAGAAASQLHRGTLRACAAATGRSGA